MIGPVMSAAAPIPVLRPVADFSEQATVTNWPARVLLVGVVVALIALALGGMRRGWLRRQKTQSLLPKPASDPPAELLEVLPVAGVYLGTARSGAWLDRVAVHDLGVRSRATVRWGRSGVFVDRSGASSLYIPTDRILGVRVDRGVAGTVRAKDSVVVVSWRLGDVAVDSGFRADDGVDHRTLLDGLMAEFPGGARA